MTSVVGIRHGHRVITTVSGPMGALTFSRQHHPDCTCRTRDDRPARAARRRKFTTR